MKAESLIFDGLQPQLYSVSELIGFQQNDSSGREAVCHNNFKIERRKMSATGGRESMPSCV